jgi:hypothetical protein
MGRRKDKKNKSKSPAPEAPQPAVDDKDLIADPATLMEKTEKKLMTDLSKRYPEVKERVSLKQAKKEKKRKESGSSSPNTSTDRRGKSSERSVSISSDKRVPYRQKSKEELKEAEFKWKNVETAGSLPPSDYTITNINQNQDLLVKIKKNALFILTCQKI